MRDHKCWHDDGPTPETGEQIELDLWRNKCMVETGEISYMDWTVRVTDLHDLARSLGLTQDLRKAIKANKLRADRHPTWG